MEGQVVLIVGGSGGIGQASADLFAKAGAKMYLQPEINQKPKKLMPQVEILLS